MQTLHIHHEPIPAWEEVIELYDYKELDQTAQRAADHFWLETYENIELEAETECLLVDIRMGYFKPFEKVGFQYPELLKCNWQVAYCQSDNFSFAYDCNLLDCKGVREYLELTEDQIKLIEDYGLDIRVEQRHYGGGSTFSHAVSHSTTWNAPKEVDDLDQDLEKRLDEFVYDLCGEAYRYCRDAYDQISSEDYRKDYFRDFGIMFTKEGRAYDTQNEYYLA